MVAENSWAGGCRRQGGHGESLRRSHGDGVQAQLGAGPAEGKEGERGNHHGPAVYMSQPVGAGKAEQTVG